MLSFVKALGFYGSKFRRVENSKLGFSGCGPLGRLGVRFQLLGFLKIFLPSG